MLNDFIREGIRPSNFIIFILYFIEGLACFAHELIEFCLFIKFSNSHYFDAHI